MKSKNTKIIFAKLNFCFGFLNHAKKFIQNLQRRGKWSKIILEEKFNLNTVYFSIDDFYKTLKMRKLMSKKVNKLFLTRGVPGTHDTKILYKCLKNLKNKLSLGY